MPTRATTLAIIFSLAACAAPDLDGVQWPCESTADCVDGFVCGDRARVCVEELTGVDGVTKDRVRVGLTGPLSTGPVALGQAMQDGIEAYFAQVNNDGGLDGRRIELVARDDGNDPERAVTNVERLLDDREVFALLGSVGHESVSTTVPVTTRRQVINYGAHSGGTALRAQPPNRYVFNIRPGLVEEYSRAVAYLTTVRDPRITPQNIALFTEGEDDVGTLGAYGQDGLDALSRALGTQHDIDAGSIVVASYPRNATGVDGAVGVLLAWMASGELTFDADVRLRAAVVLNAHARQSALLVKLLLDELTRIRNGAGPSPQFALSDEQLGRLAELDDVVFIAVSTVGGDALAEELEGLGTYFSGTETRAYCDGVVTLQVVPDYRGASPGIQAYRTALARWRPDAEPGFTSLEGYLVARSFVEGLLRHGPRLETEGVIDTFDTTGEIDLDIGIRYEFTPTEREASQDVWGTRLSSACVHDAVDFDRPERPVPEDPCAANTCEVLTGTITEDLTLDARRPWLLRGPVFIGDGISAVTLTIEPGTRIFAEVAAQTSLVVQRSARIMAEGTREAPIIFTSSRGPRARQAGDWTGIAINGRAPVNGCEVSPCILSAGDGTMYGGSDPMDSSGVLRYVRVEFAGLDDSDGLGLRGVGSGTTIDYVQVHRCADDGLELDGGTVGVRHVLITASGDDSIDWNLGWQGRAQYVIVQQWADAADNGIQADNNEQNRNALPRSAPLIANLTLIGVPTSPESDFGILFRDGTAGNIHNSIVLGFNRACIDIDDEETFAIALTETGTLTGRLTLENSIVDCPLNFEEEDGDPVTVESFVSALNVGNRLVDPDLRAPYTLTGLDARPEPGAPAATGGVPLGDPFFEAVTYVGAVDPAMDWTTGWTTSEPN